MTEETKAVVSASILCAAIALYMGACTANAIEQVARIENPATSPAPIAAVRLCDAAGCTPEVAVTIAPGTRASVRFPVAPLAREVYAQARGVAGGWSGPSNRLDVAACLSVLACRADLDGDGAVLGSDFTALSSVFGARR